VDGDFLVRNLPNTESTVLDRVVQIASTPLPIEEGVDFLIDTAGSKDPGRVTSTRASGSGWTRAWAPPGSGCSWTSTSKTPSPRPRSGSRPRRRRIRRLRRLTRQRWGRGQQ